MGGEAERQRTRRGAVGRTGHAEAVKVSFDPDGVNSRELLEIFFVIHDPTTMNRQGHDVGAQYRSAIFYHSPEQKRIAEEVMASLTRDHVYSNPIVTELVAATTWHEAEPYHQEYFARNPFQGYCTAVVEPKVAKFRKLFTSRLKS